MCPRLVLVEEDPSAAEQAWEGVLLRLDYSSGFSVESVEPGCAYFETRGVERLYGGLEEALKRALASAARGGTLGSARPSGASPPSPPPTSRARGRRSSSPTSRCRSFSRRCRSRCSRSTRGASSSFASWESNDWASLPGSPKLPWPNVGAGRAACLEPGERGRGGAGAGAAPARRALRGARVSGGDRQRAHPAARVRRAARPAARAKGARWKVRAQGRAGGPTRGWSSVLRARSLHQLAPAHRLLLDIGQSCGPVSPITS